MGKSLTLSLIVHALLAALLVWSDKITLEILKRNREKKLASSVIQVDLTYKPSDTAMRKGAETRDLPPPDIAPAVKMPEAAAPKLKKPAKKLDEKNDLKKAKNDLKDILKKMKTEARKEDRPPPKIENFPTSHKGEIGARGTGGRSDRLLSPAELALQAAMRRHFDLTDARNFRKAYPNAEGYIAVELTAVANQFQIRGLKVLESTGFDILDQSCERAIRAALDEETFAPDVLQELNGKDSAVICKP